jgi:hypothetical protein
MSSAERFDMLLIYGYVALDLLRCIFLVVAQKEYSDGHSTSGRAAAGTSKGRRERDGRVETTFKSPVQVQQD